MKLQLLFFFLISPVLCFSQYLPNSGYIESGSLLGIGREAPFWLQSNRFGQYSDNKLNVILKTGLQKTEDSSKNFDFSYSLDIIDRFDTKNQIYFHQAFLQFNYRIFQFHIGKKEEIFGDQDRDLSSGNMLWSGNARPVPEIAFSVPNFIPVIRGIFDIKGYISHGWVNDNSYIKNYFLHHKNAYIRLGSKFPVTFSYGLEHFAQWGGTSPEYGELPHKLRDFKEVFFAQAGSAGSPWIDTLNRLGNHLGSKNFTLEIKSKPIYTRLYWQYIFEDASKDHWENIADGLWGVSMEFKKYTTIHKVVLEYINTTNQSGPAHIWNDTIKLGGQDDYFNNSVYRNGWKYYKRIIGTPFITPENTIDSIGTRNNCIRAWHIGFMGTFKEKINYRILVTRIHDYGTTITHIGSYIYTNNPIKKSTSVLLETSIPLKTDLFFQISLAADLGYKYNSGVLVTIRKSFIR